jgi:8-oxo-dGTP pyrophosphatase MutT (NUDIX family)
VLFRSGAAPGWEERIASALRGAARPIELDPRFAPRDRAGRTNRERNDRSRFPEPRLASTLLLVYPGSHGELSIPLTVRNAGLPAHPGEVSLPGGAVDPGDVSRAATALREAEEEIGIDPRTVRVHGALDDIWIPVSNFEIRPFVATSTARPELRPHSAEVTEIVELPVAVLLDPALVAEEEIAIRGLILRAAVYRHAGHRIWGATARTLAMFGAVLQPVLGARPSP